MRIFTIILFLTFGLLNNLFAVTYKWVDDTGHVVYSQQPPEDDRQYQRLKDSRKYGESSSSDESTEKPETGSGDSAGSEASSGAEAGSGEEKETGYSEEDIARRAEMKEKNCKSAKDALDLYTVHKRFKNEDGSVTTLSNQQRQENIKKAEAAVQEFCN